MKAHLSVLLAVLALVQGVNYYLQRLSLVLGTNHFFDGASYADVHAMRPALVLLIAISVIAAGLFLYNVRQQGWLLPVVAVVLWALVWALVANVYPALVQSLVVNPSQNAKEAPYIQDNITATNAALRAPELYLVRLALIVMRDIAELPGRRRRSPRQMSPGTRLQAQTNKQTLANVPSARPNRHELHLPQATRFPWVLHNERAEHGPLQPAGRGSRASQGNPGADLRPRARPQPGTSQLGQHAPSVHARLRGCACPRQPVGSRPFRRVPVLQPEQPAPQGPTSAQCSNRASISTRTLCRLRAM